MRLARSADTLVVDQSLPLTAIIPARYGIASELGAVWNSSDTSVAVVTQGGMVFGLKSGIATVDVTTHGSSSATKLTVRPSIRLVRFDADTLALGLSQAVRLPFRAIDSDGRPVDLSKHRVEWTSSAPDIATLSSDGGVTGKALGATDVRLSVDGKASFIRVQVKRPAVSSVSISPSSLNATVGQQTQLSASVTDAAGNELFDRAVTWNTSDASEATVSTSGLLTAISAGTVKITAISGNKRGSIYVNVLATGSEQPPDTVTVPAAVPVASVTMTLNSSTLTIGQTTQATATVRDANSNILTGRPVSWTSSDATIVSVDGNGLVSAAKAGSAVITASVEGKSADAVVVVSAPVPVPRTITVSTNRSRLAIGELAQATAVVKDANGAVIPNAVVSWASTPTSVVTISTSGVAMGRSVGTATISASIASLAQSVQLTVVDSAVPVAPTIASVAVSPSGVRLTPGQTMKLAANAEDAAGAPISNATIAWSTSNSSVANVDASGTVRGVAPGSAIVTALAGDQSAAATVTVTDLSVASVSVTLNAASLTVGQTTQATATISDAVGQTLSGRVVTWTSGNSAVATVSPTGLVSAVGAGTAVLTATSEGVKGSATVTVTAVPPPPPPPVAGVPINPGESIQSKVDANPSGTTFLIKAGTHVRQSVVPKSGDSFVGEPGAILDGGGTVNSAFGPGSTRPANVTIRRLEITNYGPTSSGADYYGTGAVTAGGHSAGEGTRGWVVDSNYIHDNRGMGIRIGHTMTVRGNRIIHNAGPHGLGGIGDSTLIEGNEIATNNYNRTYDPGFSAGGFKIVESYGVVIRRNWIHGNYGFGAWGDIANRNMTFDGNTVEDNSHTGIFYEISYGCKVTNNTVRRNGLGDAGNWLYPAGILIAHSPDCEVSGNTLEGNVHGIIGIQQNRTDDMDYGPHTLKNLWVHDNVVTQGSSGFAAGVAADAGDPFAAAMNNRYDRNRYTVTSSNGEPFAWADAGRSWSAWRGYGQDAAGALTSR